MIRTATGTARRIRFPFWGMLILAALPTAIVWCRDRRPPKGHCCKCGYNLTGNTSGTCPECGELVET
jgi:hypothetical protein